MEPQAAAPQPKKKLGALGWILIGCLGIVVLAGIVVVGGGFFVAKKVKDVAQDFEKNPARTAAEMVVRVNPDLELVSADDEAETLTIRNKKTGELITADWSEIRQGKLRLEADGKNVTFDAQGAASGEGPITITDDSGDEKLVIGGGDASAVPDWFPAYAGASDVGSTFASKSGREETGLFTFTSRDAIGEVLAFYRRELGALDFELSESTYMANGSEGGSISGSDGAGRTVSIGMTRQNGRTEIVVNYSMRRQ